MYRSARLRVAAASAAIVCLLFSQLAVASFACPALLHTAVAASAPEPADHADGADHCAGNDTARSGLCLAHCSPAQLSLNQPQADAPPAILVAVQPCSVQPETALLAKATPHFDVPLRSQSPPHAILHCCFRI
ncbi:MAG: hypothetical protein KAX84_19150 [Burkholderiales bacterium]|nr:hypothetical protein [Betaproteobacteria bacterium]MBP8298234.1 hypothetical protein [Burkholderiales bacterium]